MGTFAAPIGAWGGVLSVHLTVLDWVMICIRLFSITQGVLTLAKIQCWPDVVAPLILALREAEAGGSQF